MSDYVVEPQRQYYARPRDQRFEDMPSLRTAVERRRNLSRVTDVTLAELTPAAGTYFVPGTTPPPEVNTVFLTTPKSPFPFLSTHYAFSQFCSRIKAPANYLRELPPPLLSQVMKFSMEQQAKEEKGDTRLMAWPVPLGGDDVDDEVYELRAATSTTYGRIWDLDVVDMVQQIIDATGKAFENPLIWGGKRGGLYASDRDVFLFLVDGGSIVDGGSDRDQLHRGFYVWNSEVGNATFGIATFLFRGVCGNHGIWGAEQLTELRIRHSLNAPARFLSEAAPALKAHVEAPAAPLEAKIRQAKAFEIPGAPNKEKLIEFGRQHGLTPAEVKGAIAYAEREEGAEVSNLWVLQQGLTAYARDFAWVDARVDLERRAGKLMALAA